jgi:hypothetical protein
MMPLKGYSCLIRDLDAPIHGFIENNKYLRGSVV